jgi:hypothetical protein
MRWETGACDLLVASAFSNSAAAGFADPAHGHPLSMPASPLSQIRTRSAYIEVTARCSVSPT